LKEYSQAQDSGLLTELNDWKALEETKIEPLPVDRSIPKEKRKYRHNETITICLEEKSTNQILHQLNRVYNTEINDILLTALGLSIQKWAGIDNIPVNLEGHGREPIIPQLNINRTLGWFTSLYPVVLDMKKVKDISYGIRWIKETLRKIKNKGIAYGILKYLTPKKYLNGLSFTLQPEISFNYLGQFGQENVKPGEPSFKISDVKIGNPISPQSERPYKLYITGMVIGKQLRFSFSYNCNEYHKESIKDLADCYKSNLMEIITHCLEKEEKALTPSDLAYSEISLEELEELQAVMEEID
jgi:non-ribosomal peptide synthase protein (TIGR01720 family)